MVKNRPKHRGRKDNPDQCINCNRIAVSRADLASVRRHKGRPACERRSDSDAACGRNDAPPLPLADGRSHIRTIVQEHASCIVLKHEDWPGLENISALRGFQADGSMKQISILTGNGVLFLDFEMERGADGAMTGYAFLDMLVELVWSDCRRPANATRLTICSMRTFRCFATSSSRAWDWPSGSTS